MAAHKFLIKKYTNRKLNGRRVAISLSRGIPRLVREGHDIHLASTGRPADSTPDGLSGGLTSRGVGCRRHEPPDEVVDFDHAPRTCIAATTARTRC